MAHISAVHNVFCQDWIQRVTDMWALTKHQDKKNAKLATTGLFNLITKTGLNEDLNRKGLVNKNIKKITGNVF